MSLLALLLALAGWGQEEEEGYEVIVYGEMLVEQARKEVVEDLQGRGYTEVKEKGDRVIYRHEAAWKGEVVVYDDGWVRMRRQRPRVQGPDVPWAEAGSPGSYAACLLVPWRCVRIGGWTVSGRKYHAQQQRTLAPMEVEIHTYGDRVADLGVEYTVLELPERLEALWDEGVPLEGTRRAHTWPERRKALVAYWDSRTCTEWGDRVREAVEAFARGVVQTSDHPFTEAEVAAVNEGRRCSRPLLLTRTSGDVADGE